MKKNAYTGSALFFRGFTARALAIVAIIIGFGSNAETSAQSVKLAQPENVFSGATKIKAVGKPGEVYELLEGDTVFKTSLRSLGPAMFNRASSASFTFTTSPTNSMKIYSLQATNSFTPAGDLPPEYGLKIFSLPEDQISPVNSNALFTIQAEPTNPTNTVTYQWFKNDVKMDGESQFFLLLQNVQTNFDVAFYSCDVQAGTNPVYRARSKECDAPGARLFVYEGTNTPCTGPYQPAPPGSSRSCVGSYIGWVQMKNADTWSRFYGTTYFERPSGTTKLKVTDTTNLTDYQSVLYILESGSTRPAICGASPQDLDANPPPKLYQITVYVTHSGTSIAAGKEGTVTIDALWHN